MKVTRRLREQLAPAARDLADQARDLARERLTEPRGHPAPSSAAAAPDAPGNRPRTAFVGVLDGRHLWLAVDATPGALALREPAGESRAEQVLPLASDLAEDDPRYRSVRSDLAALPGDGPARFEVVVTAPGGKVHRVWTPPLPQAQPVRVPTAGGTQWQVARAQDGTLELVREPAPAAAHLVAIEAGADDVTTLRLAGVAEGALLRLLDDESGEVLLTRPFELDGPLAVATVDHRDVPEGIGLSASVYAGDLPVRRSRDDLTRPDQAVLLPQVQNDAGDGPSFSLVFRWLPDGVLRVRRPKGAGA